MLHAVIPAGGSGTRLWPLSRADHPKFLLPLTGTGRSLLQATLDRLAPLAPPEHSYVVTGLAHAVEVSRQLPAVPAGNILVEPSPRDSCAAIGLAAALIAQRHPNAIMGSFAADHLVRDLDRFTAAIRAAITGAEQGWLVTVGMKPTHPETGYGYVHYGEPTGTGAAAGATAEAAAGATAGADAAAAGESAPAVRRVRRFKEKPTFEVAKELVASGEYLWNASIFLWRVDVFLAELARQRPRLHDGLVEIAAAWDTPRRDAVLGEIWPGLEKIAVDYAVMEDAAARGKVATVPGDFGWTDVGDFRNLGDVLTPDEAGNVVLKTGAAEPDPHRAPVLLDGSRGMVTVSGGDRLVALLGLKDVVVVDTPDALLVCARDRAQDVKQLVDELKRTGGDGYL